MHKIALSRYSSIKTRSTERFIELFLIWCFFEDTTLSNATFDRFKSFSYDDPLLGECNHAFQLSKESDPFGDGTIGELDSTILNWEKANIKLKNEFKSHYQEQHFLSKEEFLSFFGEDDFDRQCHYCKIKESEIKKLIEDRKILTKTLATRGKTFEVDRLQANKGYTIKNIVLCCYWCNNAKTDEFDELEFKPIGEAIGKTFRKRLTKSEFA
ncbi:hypothetical protein [Reichenbachiella sp.]|uniref:hypothetical protein n=1 Tax=Reichenbachiella sp. TaxID=2184521 RepID=UPI003297E3F1